MKTRYLNRLQFRGLNQVGDAFVPGGGEFPSFSKLGCAEHADLLFSEMPERDRKDLLTLLMVFAFLPRFIVAGQLRLFELGAKLPGEIGALFRLIRFGLKGVVTSLYYSGYHGSRYSGKTPLELIGYDAKVHTADLDNA